jgi:hypothetical protein
MRLPDLWAEIAQCDRAGKMHDACMVRYVDSVATQLSRPIRRCRSLDWRRTPLRHRAVARLTGERLPFVTGILFLNQNGTHPPAANQASRRFNFTRRVLITRHVDSLVLSRRLVVTDSHAHMKRKARESHNRDRTAVPIPQLIGWQF